MNVLIFVCHINFVCRLFREAGDSCDPEACIRDGKRGKQPSSEPASIQATSVTEEAPSGYNYRPSGRRDPFRSLILGLKEKKNGGTYSSSAAKFRELKVIGIMWEGKSYVAMIETTDAKGYLIREGVLVGPEGGGC